MPGTREERDRRRAAPRKKTNVGVADARQTALDPADVDMYQRGAKNIRPSVLAGDRAAELQLQRVAKALGLIKGADQRIIISTSYRPGDDRHIVGSIGSVIVGEVLQVASGVVYVDIGRKKPVALPVGQVTDAEGNIQVKVGDHLGYVDTDLAPQVQEFVAQVPMSPLEQFSDEDKQDVEHVMSNLAPFLLRLTRQQRRNMRESVLREFVGDLTPSPIDIERERLHAKTLQWIFEGAQWMSAAELAELAGVSVPTTNRWKKERKVFAVFHAGRDLYPRYAFDNKLRPLPVVAEVLSILIDSSDESIAAWFESTSSFLQGKRPREIVASEFERVKAAAENTVLNEQYAG